MSTINPAVSPTYWSAIGTSNFTAEQKSQQPTYLYAISVTDNATYVLSHWRALAYPHFTTFNATQCKSFMYTLFISVQPTKRKPNK
jgi:hypothetical protein